MALHRIKRGLDLPIAGAPAQRIEDASRPSSVALMADDYVGLRPQFLAKVGDVVKRGQPLFEDKRNAGVVYTSPGAGTLAAIHRGERRALISVVIELSPAEREGQVSDDETQPLESFTGKEPSELTSEDVRRLLLESGLWTAFRTRPMGKVPAPDSSPDAIFVTAIDTNPLCADPDVILEGNEATFRTGIECVRKLTDGPVFLCQKPGGKASSALRTHDAGPGEIRVEEFEGPHPAGTVGLHVHRLRPVNRQRTVWHLGCQDVVAIGNLCQTGRIDLRRVVALGGSQVKNPRLLTTRVGASLDEVLAGELVAGESRVVSGSVLSGRPASGEIRGFLGRYHSQVTVLREDREREFLGWMSAGTDKYSVLAIFLSKLLGKKSFAMHTGTYGSPRAIVPVGVYERVFPFDILPTPLLQCLEVEDFDQAEKLGCLELDEEDLALCSFVDPSKGEFGLMLRRNLERIEKEG